MTINKVPLVEMCHQTFHVFWSIKENIQHAIWNMMQQKFDWLKPARQKETVNDADIFINQICAHTTVVVLTDFMILFAYICSSFTSKLKVQSHIFCEDVGKNTSIWSSVAQFQVHKHKQTSAVNVTACSRKVFQDLMEFIADVSYMKQERRITNERGVEVEEGGNLSCQSLLVTRWNCAENHSVRIDFVIIRSKV